MENRNPGESRDTGLGEVHSHISQPDKGVSMSGQYGSTSSGGGAGEDARDLAAKARDRAGTMVDDARDQAENVAADVKSRANDLRHRAEEAVGQARASAGQALDRAETELEERTGVISMIRDNPLPAVAVAFGVGYLLAGRSSGKRGRVTGMATRQLRTAIMGGISAALMREVRGILEDQGGTLGSLLGNDSGTGSTRRERGESGFGGRTADAF
jgi:ElaB/YqjD/DUF883 family membrane-anchored ribosome-binding protein